MRNWTRVIAATCIGALLLWGPPAAGQEEEDLTAGLRVLREAVETGSRQIDDLEFGLAILSLDSVIEPRRERDASELSLEELRLVSAAYDMRARAYFNVGDSRRAERDFESLLRLDPSYPLDRQTLSPKVVALFDAVRARVVGLLRLGVEPRGARVTLDGDAMEPASWGQIGLLAGEHRLRIEMRGYAPHDEMVTAAAGTRIDRSIRLRPNRRTLEFISVPAGATVSLDGEIVGTTQGPATPEVAALASKYGFDPRSASAPLVVDMVTPGAHKVSFERECSVTRKLKVRVDVDVERNTPLRLAPVILEDARVDLRVSSIPSGADVIVDGKKRGTTPLTVSSLCAGKREVTILKQDVGRWSERIRVASGRVNTLDVRLRPTLMYAGTFRLDEWGRAVWSDEDAPLLRELGRGLKTLNLVRSSAALAEFRESIIEWMISDPMEVRAGTILPPTILRAAARKAGADLVLAGLTEADDPEKRWTMVLYSVLHPLPDVVDLIIDDAQGVREFVARLDSAPPTSVPWWGMGLADTLLDDQRSDGANGRARGPLVVRVLPGSPAAKSGLRVGDRIRTVGSRDAREVSDLSRAVAVESAKPGGVTRPVALTVENAGGERTVRLAPGVSPAVIPLSDPDLLYNRALAEFRLRSRAARDEQKRGLALLNLGIAYMHFRAYDKAHSDGFARASLLPGSGISEGTVLYYRGLCALRRGDEDAARRAFEGAARARNSTLDTGDGPSAAAAGSRMLRALQ